MEALPALSRQHGGQRADKASHRENSSSQNIRVISFTFTESLRAKHLLPNVRCYREHRASHEVLQKQSEVEFEIQI